MICIGQYHHFDTVDLRNGEWRARDVISTAGVIDSQSAKTTECLRAELMEHKKVVSIWN